ncbi:N-alpha-acetyltransferase 50 [Fulvia fulva]|uniref:N-alpha-acetyltransferase 50 n=1 Tax=Passalora fulva TaxID=5499 RepID=A0A9Q8L6C4_PASFU|nr:N-alpha-acetyltransferase 50 [Fulvia fulva]KAK4635658.1 N-alpha-acetyltransferase 50 [Fulvia fulva]KAK4637193.1 N-alpha-acetyltransferase 50 [Fulvia fulva]UJO11559.1 N-alpha-acetyltransferase 50 [Fulvia fulva]WPV08153.1 N-alpha-acetyltransferase 50 [Fulvia fulva]WPV23757.1 N-alpha-acetyltransferase 50 [Fulvia fulva]
MPQSSLMTWLNKPRAVNEPPKSDKVSPEQHEPGSNDEHTSTESDDDCPLENGPMIPSNVTETATKQVLPPTAPKGHLPPNVDFRSCTKQDIFHLKRLTSLLLPIPYPDSFYREIIEDLLSNNITMLAVWHDDPAAKGQEKGRLIGAIRCRLFAHSPVAEAHEHFRKGPMLYLSTLVLLSPYRSHGIATQLLHILTKRAIEDYGISRVGAHVWVANTEGLEWYRKRGFREVRRESGYYRRLDPQDAVVMQKDVGPSDLLPS